MKKLYRFYDKRGVSVDVEALTILDAKQKLKELGCEGFTFYSIKVLFVD
jgi:hypothetical protein